MTYHSLDFGPFRLFPVRRVLEKNGAIVKISGRAMDILLALLDHAGKTLSKNELMSIVWPDTSIDEGSIRVHMSGLRKALEDGRSNGRYIINVSGKGYAFIAPIVSKARPLVRQRIENSRHTLPSLVTSVIGRSDFNQGIVDELPVNRFVTIVGPGGVGKTTAALSIANSIRHRYDDGVFFIDLAPVQRSEHVGTAVAAVVVPGRFSDDPIAALSTHLGDKSALMVLDNCEHLLNTASAMSRRLLTAAPNIHILATSREPLKADGEWVRRLPPLKIPLDVANISVRDVMSYPAVEMFVVRAKANASEFAVTPSNVRILAKLCKQLDGIPLAIEFAASRIEEFGLEGVAERIGDRFNLLTKGRRNVLPRHQTLKKTIDWSYNLLSSAEAADLRRISIFAGTFDAESARALAKDVLEAQSVENVLESLVSRSMLVVVNEWGIPRYRMLEMTREYAAERLRESGEYDDVALRHAEHCLILLKRAETEWSDGPSTLGMAGFAQLIGEVRQAIEWTLSSHRNLKLGVKIIAFSSVLFTSLGFIDEHRLDLEQGIKANELSDRFDPLMATRMYSALGNALYQQQGDKNDEATKNAFLAAVSAAKEAKDASYELRALSGLSAAHNIRGFYKQAAGLASELILAGGEHSHAVHRTLAHTMLLAGKLELTKFHLDEAFATRPHDISSTGAQFDHRLVTLRTTLSQYHFLCGETDTSLAIIDECLAEAALNEHPISLCHHLCGTACSVVHSVKGLDAALPLVELLKKTSDTHSMGMWQEWGRGFEAVMTPRDERSGTAHETYLRRLSHQGITGPRIEFLSILGDRFVEPWTIEASLRGSSEWCRPELIRAKAEIDLRNGGDETAAREGFRLAIDTAKVAGLLIWELRAAISFAGISKPEDRSMASDFLTDILAKFTEGFHGLDYLKAVRMRAELEHELLADKTLS